MRHPVEERLQRLLAILADVAGKGPVRLAELSRHYQVSLHQLRTDLALAGTMGVPPYDLPGETPVVTFHGDLVEVWVPAHFAVQPALTRPEGLAVLTAGRSALALNPDLDALGSAMDKLAGALGLEGGVEVDLEIPVHLDRLRDAMARRHRVEVVYWSSWRDELTVRQVEPLQVVFLLGEWYLQAWDEPSREIRRFRVDRIERCDDTGEPFEPRPFELLTEAFVPPTFAEHVTVWFPASARWVTEYVEMQIESPADRVGAEDGDGSDPVGDDGFTAVVCSVGDRWLERLLLRTGGQVVAPEERVGLRRRAAQRLLAAYEDASGAGAGSPAPQDTETAGGPPP